MWHLNRGESVELENSFTISTDIETAWKTILDVEKIAPCMPGATLESINGDEFSGNVKVKLGPVSMVYGGEARFTSKDDATHTAIIDGTGKESRGTGTATAHVAITLVAESTSVTRVDVTTELTITGKAAQFGRGVMQDVAGRLVTQFAGNLEQVITIGDGTAADGAPAPIKTADSVNLLATAGAPVLKRVVPVVLATAVVVGVVIFFISNR
jgi:carbon monoxide dehydrogenase subunit G